MKVVATKKDMTTNFFHPSLLLLFLDPGSGIRDPRSEIRDPRSGIRDPRSRIRDPRSRIRDPRSGINIPDPQHCKKIFLCVWINTIWTHRIQTLVSMKTIHILPVLLSQNINILNHRTTWRSFSSRRSLPPSTENRQLFKTRNYVSFSFLFHFWPSRLRTWTSNPDLLVLTDPIKIPIQSGLESEKLVFFYKKTKELKDTL